MNTDFKSLEQRYGTLLATKIQEEIVRADQKRFSFYKIPEAFRALRSAAQDYETPDYPEINTASA